MNKLYCDGSFDWNSTEKTTENVVRGKIAVSCEKFERVDKVAIGKVPMLKQYINILELTAIARAVELAIENNLEGELSIWTDSQTAMYWARNNVIKPKLEGAGRFGRKGGRTPAHDTALDYLNGAVKKYREKNMAYGEITFNFINREHNPAGHLLQEELDNGNKPHDI